MLFYNKTIKDILWKSELDSLAKSNAKKFKLTHILTRPEPEWTGKTGAIDTTSLKE